MRETSLYSLFQVNQPAGQTEDASLNWLKYQNDGSGVFRLLQLLMDCVQDENQIVQKPIFIDDIDRVYINVDAELPFCSTLHTNKHISFLGDFFTSIIRGKICKSTPFEDKWLISIETVFSKIVNNELCSKSVKFFAGYCITHLLTALQNIYTAIHNEVSSEGHSTFFALYTRLASALCEVFVMCLQTDSYLPCLVYLFRESLPPLRYLLTSKIFNPIQKKFVLRICRAVVSEMTAHLNDCITEDLRPILIDGLKMLVLKSLSAFASNSIEDCSDNCEIYRYLVNDDRDIRRLTAKLFVAENPKSTALKALKYHRQYQKQNDNNMQLFIDAFGKLQIFIDYKKMFKFVQKNGFRRRVACHAIAAILNSVKHRQNKLKKYPENTKIWEPFFKHLASALVKIDRYDPIVYHNLLEFFFDVFNVENLMKNEKIAMHINDFMHNLSTKFAQTEHYMLAVRLVKVSRIRAFDPLLVSFTEMAMVEQECFNSAWHKFSSFELCLATTMRMYVLLDLTDDDDNVFDTTMLLEMLQIYFISRSILLADCKVQGFFVMICAKVLAFLNGKTHYACNDQFQWMCQRLAQKRIDDTDREPFFEYMIFNAVCFMLIKFMPQDTSENPQSVSQNVTVHLNRVISDHLNDFLATFIDKVSTFESLYQARGMIRSLTKVYELTGNDSNMCYSPRLFSFLWGRQPTLDADIFKLIMKLCYVVVDLGPVDVMSLPK